MRIILGSIVMIAGIGGLTLWGATERGPGVEDQIRVAAEAATRGAVHSIKAIVSGRDITLTGIADTEEELATIVAALDKVEGHRGINFDTVDVIPVADPYSTALAKAGDGSLNVSGFIPNAAAAATLEQAGVVGATDLPLASGAPDQWEAAFTAGADALASLDHGNFALTSTKAMLSGVALSAQRAEAARSALANMPSGYETVTEIEVNDPGVVTFELRYDPVTGLDLDGSIPETLGPDGIAAAMGLPAPSGEIVTTDAAMEGLGDMLTELSAVLPDLNGLTLRVEDGQVAEATAQVLPGLDIALVGSVLSEALGRISVDFTDPVIDAEPGTTRQNIATGETEVLHEGHWLVKPDFDVAGAVCTERAQDLQEERRIGFLTGSAELDKPSLAVINDLAGLVLHCTQAYGMRVTIGGHTDSDGDENENFALSVARANAVRNALAARGISPQKMVAIGYGETEPIASNDTEEGRAANRRTTFDWQG
ncbi:OmpA family protein [Maritimibacter dapengensis]|uniref:OmpA family protein n=1 Tax=Maritimibacter dapengensis TaxID=2836868 RepID=A0ABS6SWU0_9RHOB|nr:OmpA family protein [Maritimibacter dapengensis]MBV7377422.1 OmpA family protein [Maritimibacter dapengensis]